MSNQYILKKSKRYKMKKEEIKKKTKLMLHVDPHIIFEFCLCYYLSGNFWRWFWEDSGVSNSISQRQKGRPFQTAFQKGNKGENAYDTCQRSTPSMTGSDQEGFGNSRGFLAGVLQLIVLDHQEFIIVIGTHLEFFWIFPEARSFLETCVSTTSRENHLHRRAISRRREAFSIVVFYICAPHLSRRMATHQSHTQTSSYHHCLISLCNSS